MAVNWSVIIAGLQTALETALQNPGPNYTIRGQTVAYGDYIAMLREQLSEAEKSSTQGAGGAWQLKKKAVM